ncbi:MAG: hypothetical protein JWQ35_154 [Bacteriovoracaceae bacterium]|nr:hypothetical protein [Bacteriovoracaceae bacterium]
MKEKLKKGNSKRWEEAASLFEDSIQSLKIMKKSRLLSAVSCRTAKTCWTQ